MEHINNDHPQTDHQPTPSAQPTPAPRRYVRPRATIRETATDFVVQVEMPGVNRQGLEITVENGELTLLGHRAHAVPAPGLDLVYRESRPVDFRRTLEVDSSIDTARVSAGHDAGLLTLTLPKAEAARPRRIEINGLS